MILQKVIQKLHEQRHRPIDLMKKTLSGKIRSGNEYPQSNSRRTADSIMAEFPQITTNFVLWDFKAEDTAIRLNTGGSRFAGKEPTDVPYGRFLRKGGESAYIEALISWAESKFGLNRREAKRMAFKVAASASKRGRTVKAKGWLDDLKSELDRMIQQDLTSILSMEINKELQKNLKL
tara:strand:- start:48 stop:581 length:534 start_codon:yes stop_codon:yes gene_type:complete